MIDIVNWENVKLNIRSREEYIIFL